MFSSSGSLVLALLSGARMKILIIRAPDKTSTIESGDELVTEPYILASAL